MPSDIQFAVYIPNFGPFHSPEVVAEAAREAEAAGWDGLFIWDHVMWEDEPVGDPWIALAAAASATSRIRLGPVAVPLPRRRPWQIARAATSLDLLSGGRTILGVGIGSDAHGDFSRFDEELDPGTRGRMLDEGLAVIQALWSDDPVRFTGSFYELSDVSHSYSEAQDPYLGDRELAQPSALQAGRLLGWGGPAEARLRTVGGRPRAVANADRCLGDQGAQIRCAAHRPHSRQ